VQIICICLLSVIYYIFSTLYNAGYENKLLSIVSVHYMTSDGRGHYIFEYTVFLCSYGYINLQHVKVIVSIKIDLWNGKKKIKDENHKTKEFFIHSIRNIKKLMV
jgi:hypothetical protein